MNAALLAVALFAATNLDELFVLIGFFASPGLRTREIVIGQYLGIAVLLLASVALSLVSLVLDPAWVGLLGLLPVAIGAKQLFDVWRGAAEAEDEPARASLGHTLSVALVTLANGGDNIAAWVPVLATRTPADIAIISAVFAVMVALWLAVAHWLVNHPTLGAPIRRYGHLVTPLVLIAIGLFVLLEAHSFALLGGRS